MYSLMMKKPFLKIALFVTLFAAMSGCADASDSGDMERMILSIRTKSAAWFSPKDALAKSIRNNLDIDVYTGRKSIYLEWDEKGLPIVGATVQRERKGEKRVRKVSRMASDIGHRWNWYVDRGLTPDTEYRYRVTLLLKNGKKREERFRVRTRAGSSESAPQKRRFRLYDDIEGGAGDKAAWLAKHTSDGTMRSFGLCNSAMYWVDDFYRPKPDIDDSRSRLLAKPDIRKLQALVKADMHASAPHLRIDPRNGIVVLDIEHVPSVLEYVTREYSPYGAFVSKYIETPKVRERGRKIVLEAIARKLEAIRAVKALLPHTMVGLWNSVVLWNRYDDNSRNRDDRALAKGTGVPWRITYPEWHPNDSLIYKPLIDTVDYVMPISYPMFDLRTPEGKKRQRGYMLSKFTELRRINPDVTIIPSISPHYTEGWSYRANLAHQPLSEADFSWYLNLLYRYYEEGLIDSVHIWADNDGTKFTDFTHQGWWKALLAFTKRHTIVCGGNGIKK